jgi:hypothetical protein
MASASFQVHMISIPSENEWRAALTVPPDLWPVSNNAYQADIETFVKDSKAFTDASRYTNIALDSFWCASYKAPNIPLSEHLKIVSLLKVICGE